MPIVIDPAQAEAAGRRLILRDMQKAKERQIGEIGAGIRSLVSDVEVSAPQGWRQALDEKVAALKVAVQDRKDIKDAIAELP